MLTEQKYRPEMIKMLLTLDDQVYKVDEEDIALAKFIENYKRKLMRNFFKN